MRHLHQINIVPVLQGGNLKINEEPTDWDALGAMRGAGIDHVGLITPGAMSGR